MPQNKKSKSMRALYSSRVLGAYVALSCMMVLGLSSAYAEDRVFADFITNMKQEARTKGISESYINALDTLSPNTRVSELAARQPEYIKPIWEYLDIMITDRRVSDGRTKFAEHKAFLDRTSAQYGMPPEILVAIWGMETNYGTILGHFPVLESLATLGYQGRRTKFGRQQLLAALEILESGDVTLENFQGSWAGAMGQTQFIPTTFLGYAVDATGDGKRDIWTNSDDALGSTANYLKVSGWTRDVPWGVRVSVPNGFDYGHANLKTKKSISEWQALGVKGLERSLDPSWGTAALYLPAGHSGPVYLATVNFFAILRYNTAPAYALSAGLLSERIRGQKKHDISWPLEDRPLQPHEIKELQGLLKTAGYNIDLVDGIPGAETRAAVLEFQHKNGLIADGYATPGVLSQIRKIVRN
jgi:membrane-bound lytic murein transglycosylase B